MTVLLSYRGQFFMAFKEESHVLFVFSHGTFFSETPMLEPLRALPTRVLFPWVEVPWLPWPMHSPWWRHNLMSTNSWRTTWQCNLSSGHIRWAAAVISFIQDTEFPRLFWMYIVYSLPNANCFLPALGLQRQTASKKKEKKQEYPSWANLPLQWSVS